MAILFTDGFDYNANITEKWNTLVGATSYMTSTPSPRTGSRSLRCASNSTSMDLRKTLSTSYTSLSVAFGLYPIGFGGNFKVALRDSAGTVQAQLNVNGAGQMLAYRGDNTTLLGTASATLSLNTWQHVEIGITISDTVGVFNIYLDGTSVLALSGIDTKQTAVAGAQFVSFSLGNANANAVNIDDVVVSDSITQIGAVIVQPLYPTGAGATTQWDPSAGNNWAAVDETPGDGDTTYVSTGTLNEIDTYVYGNLATNSGTVVAVAVNVVGRADAGGSPAIAPVIRPGSTDRIGTGFAQTASYTNYQYVWDTNPDGGSWTESAVNGSEAGVKKTA